MVVFNGAIHFGHSRAYHCSFNKFHNSLLHDWPCWYCWAVFYLFTDLYTFGTGWKFFGITDWKYNFGLKICSCCSSLNFVAICTVFRVFQEQKRLARMDWLVGVLIADKIWVYSFYDKLSVRPTIIGGGIRIWFAFVAIVICVVGTGSGLSIVVSRIFGSI